MLFLGVPSLRKALLYSKWTGQMEGDCILHKS